MAIFNSYVKLPQGTIGYESNLLLEMLGSSNQFPVETLRSPVLHVRPLQLFRRTWDVTSGLPGTRKSHGNAMEIPWKCHGNAMES